MDLTLGGIVDPLVLWIHLFSAVIFVGGSFFMWVVVVPASYLLTKDEAERTRIVGGIARRFGKITNPTLGVLILSGVYNTAWYLPSVASLFDSYLGNVLLAKIVAVVVMVVIIYANNLHYGRMTTRLAREKRLDELKKIRKTSRMLSFTSLGLMLVILALAALLQF